MARPRQISDEQILTAMRAAVLQSGPAVPLDQVATSLGVTGPALLKRFGSREALMLAALTPPERPEWVEMLEDGPSPDEEVGAQLARIFEGISKFMAEVVPCMSALRESGIPPEKVFAKFKSPDTGIKALEKWLAQAREMGLILADEVHTAAFAILGSVQIHTFFSHVIKHQYSAASQRRYHEELIALFLRALRATPLRSASRRPRRPSRSN